MRIAQAVKGWATGSFICVLGLAAPGAVDASERDLDSALASLRAGAQIQAEEYLTRFRDGERDSEIRRSVERVIPLLKRPLSGEVREYIAMTLEDSVRARARLRTRPSYALRMFPIFP